MTTLILGGGVTGLAAASTGYGFRSSFVALKCLEP